MKRLTLTTILLLIFSGLVFADSGDGGQIVYPPKIPTLPYVVDNKTGSYLTTDVSTTIIAPSNCKILGFAVYPISGGAGEYVAALHDTVTTISNTTIFGELEALSDNFAGMFFPYPVRLLNGLRIIQGPYTRVMVHWTRY